MGKFAKLVSTNVIASFLLIISACKKGSVASDTGAGIPEETKQDCFHNIEVTENDFVAPICTMPTLNEGITFSYDVQFENFTADIQTKVDRTLNKLTFIVRSKEFQDKIINHSYNGQKTFVDNDGLSNQQIYEKIIKAVEELDETKEVDYEMDLRLKQYYSSKNVVGYTYPSDPVIYLNSKYYSSFDDMEVARSLIHEYMHKLGFKHDFYNTSSRKFSVPYALGTILEDLFLTFKF
jgi:hypothetical protein